MGSEFKGLEGRVLDIIIMIKPMTFSLMTFSILMLNGTTKVSTTFRL